MSSVIKLVPIRVGMILEKVKGKGKNLTCPHTRGDDPKHFPHEVDEMRLSPYAWG